MKSANAAVLALLALLCTAGAAGQPGQRYETREAHDPDGTGRFYLGREIARVMGPGGIIWLERPERETEERSQLVIDALDIRPGQTVADLGAGSGYYTFRIAPLVGPDGEVLAVDIEPLMLKAMDERIRRDGIRNVRTVRGSAKDPHLPPRSVDLLFMVDVYHELEYPYEILQAVRTALKPGGRVALIEYRQEDPSVQIKQLHKMSEAQIVKEMSAAGFRHVETVRSLPLQHLVIFQSK